MTPAERKRLDEILTDIYAAEMDGNDVESERLHAVLVKFARTIPPIVVDSPPYDR